MLAEQWFRAEPAINVDLIVQFVLLDGLHSRVGLQLMAVMMATTMVAAGAALQIVASQSIVLRLAEGAVQWVPMLGLTLQLKRVPGLAVHMVTIIVLLELLRQYSHKSVVTNRLHYCSPITAGPLLQLRTSVASARSCLVF